MPMRRIFHLFAVLALVGALAPAGLRAQDPVPAPPDSARPAPPGAVPQADSAGTQVPISAPESAPVTADTAAAIAAGPDADSIVTIATDSVAVEAAGSVAVPASAVLPSPADSAGLPGADPADGREAEDAGLLRRFAVIGGIEEERMRLRQLSEGAPADGFLLRSASTLTPRRSAGSYAAVLAPRAEMVWNSRVPYSVNDGPLWSGKGGSGRVLAGIDAAAGPVRLVLAPELVWWQNAEFDSLLPEAWTAAQRAAFTPPWQTGTHSVDLPYRFGEDGTTRVFAGESSLTARLGAVEAGVATESQWWGPGVRNAIVLSNQAGGFPHALLRTARPLRTPLGTLEARWIAGRLSSSAYDTASSGEHRSLSGFAWTLSPGGGLSLGAARVVYQPLDGRAALADAADVFFRWGAAGDTAESQPYEQIATVFGRWVLVPHGAEVYAEWGRLRLPGLRGALEEPEHTQGYTLGLAWARPAGDARLRLSAEATYLEKSPTYRAHPTVSWYAGRAVPQGYTHRGQVLGASIGPGASGQWLAVDWMAPRAQAGISLTRVRWANDAYYDQLPDPTRRYRAHDVSILGALRGGVSVGAVWMEAEWTAGRRYNFLYQNPSLSFLDRNLSVSPFNQTLRLRFTVLP